MTIEYPVHMEFIGKMDEIADALRTMRKVIDSIESISSVEDLHKQRENAFRSINFNIIDIIHPTSPVL